jgi:YfiH family protein
MDATTIIGGTPLGRIVVPRGVPNGFALFYTTLDDPGQVTEAITDVARQQFGVECALYTCVQVHGTDVALAPARANCDALWTDRKHSALGIKVADCLPVTMIDPQRSVIANVHSGWRGAAQGITAATLATLARDSAFEPRDALAWLGPSIRVCCFEVGEEVVAQFPHRYVDRNRGRKAHIDLAAMTADVLRDAGMAGEHIIDTGLCTRCNGSIFHSFRRDGSGGRNLAIVAQ